MAVHTASGFEWATVRTVECLDIIVGLMMKMEFGKRK